MKKILFPTDLSTISKEALPYAISMADYLGAELMVLHVYEIQRTSDAFLNLSETIQKDLEQEVEHLIKNTVSQLAVSEDLVISQSVQPGDP
ncbi:MAG: universal stress protein, partial [Saprospiraceae bacterium]|nr:universal stress protein [Saprospiraceae bacterium]